MNQQHAIIPATPRRVSLPFDTALLAGQLRESSRAMYARDIAAYLAYAGSAEDALNAATFARWRAALADDPHEYSPNTINRMLSACHLTNNNGPAFRTKSVKDT